MNLKSIFNKIKKPFEIFGKFVAKTINFVALTFVYIIGIGPTAIIGKILGEKFLTLDFKNPSWSEKDTKKENIEKYYRMH
jgi:hypothetical protein